MATAVKPVPPPVPLRAAGTYSPIPGFPYHTWTKAEDEALMVRLSPHNSYKLCPHPDCPLHVTGHRFFSHRGPGRCKDNIRDHWRIMHMAPAATLKMECFLPLEKDGPKCGERFAWTFTLENHLGKFHRCGQHKEQMALGPLVTWHEKDPENRVLYMSPNTNREPTQNIAHIYKAQFVQFLQGANVWWKKPAGDAFTDDDAVGEEQEEPAEEEEEAAAAGPDHPQEAPPRNEEDNMVRRLSPLYFGHSSNCFSSFKS